MNAAKPPSPLLELRGIATGYGDSQVLFGIDLAIGPGEVATLLGRNGMGKTTTLRAVFGLLALRGGELHLDGEPLVRVTPQRMAAAGLALVPEGRRVFPTLTVEEHLRVFAPSSGPAGRHRRGPPWSIEALYELFPRLAERRRHLGSQLSGGEQQMLAIGRALSTAPRLLILDEATEGLAPLVREEIWRCLHRLKQAGLSILVIDKYVDQLMRFADVHTILEKGRVVWQGSNAALRENLHLLDRHLALE